MARGVSPWLQPYSVSADEERASERVREQADEIAGRLHRPVSLKCSPCELGYDAEKQRGSIYQVCMRERQ